MVALFYYVLQQGNYNTGTQYEFSRRRFFLAGWFLDSPSHSEFTDSFSSYQLYDPWSTVERAKCDAQFGQIPLWEGLNLQALWCSILPMVSSTLYLLCLALLLSMFLSLLIAWTPLNSGFQLTLLF